MDHLLSKEKRREFSKAKSFCLVLSVAQQREILKRENIENWIIKKQFLTEDIDEETRSRY